MKDRHNEAGGIGRSLEGKVAIVTGAARGLGRAYALRLASLGARVAVADVDLDAHLEFGGTSGGSTTVAGIEAGGGVAKGYEFDVADADACTRTCEEIAADWGRIDVLVANAGGGRGTPDETRASIVPTDLFEIVTRINLFGTVNMCRAVAPAMKENRSGKIVTVASFAGIAASADGGYAHYGANKAAIAHYTRYLAQDLGPFGINVNCIAPGMILTDRIRELRTKTSGAAGGDEQFALRRAGTVEECASAVEFLATGLSDYVTGVVLPVDGGWNRSA